MVKKMSKKLDRLLRYESIKTAKLHKENFHTRIIDAVPPPNMTDKIFINTDNSTDFLFNEFMLNRFRNKKSTYTISLNLTHSSKKYFTEFFTQKFAETSFCSISEKRGVIIDNADKGTIQYTTNYDSINLKIVGDEDWAEDIREIVLEEFDEIRCSVEWYYSSDGDSVTVPISNEQLPFDEMYPFMQESLSDYYDRYMKANASILLLIGPPGTGKTSWIKGFLHHTQSSAIVTYDPEILKRDFVFANFVSGEQNVMVIEDADVFLKARTEGNDLMHKFLNIGSGLISSAGKKLIFSTNIPNVRDVDEALVRPGRCFDILKFDLMEPKAAHKLASKVGIDTKNDTLYNESVSLAEVFNQASKSTKSISNKVGFF